MENAVVTSLERYLEKPSAGRFMRLREAVAASPGYAPYSGDLEKGYELFNAGRFEELKDHLLSIMPNWILNPGTHRLLSFAYYELGQEQEAQSEYAMAMAMVSGILSTGDGSEVQPYLVLHTDDEYDVLEYLEKRSAGQSLHTKGERHYDRQRCDDGSEVWFDVTLPLAQLRGRLAGIA